jgi:nucleoside-diphosphate-sugar epimerase
VNPAYDAALWERVIPVSTRNLIDAAAAAGARLVVIDNLYMYGRGDGRPLDEDTAPAPCSRKGEVRARAAETLLAANRDGKVRVVIARASDFHGPEGSRTHFGDAFWPAALAGRTARLLIDPDAVHTYHYTDDVAAGLVTLARAEDTDFGRIWMLPCQPAGTARALVSGWSAALGRDLRIGATPRAMSAALALFVPVVREIREMLYQWEAPFVVDDRRFRQRFGVQPAPVEVAATATVQWARRNYVRG